MSLDRIVLDSNIYVSALQFGGTANEVVSAAIAGAYVLIASNLIRREVEKTLKEKFCWNDERLALLQSGLWSAATFVESLAAAEGCRDPRDNHLLATSRAAQADMLVSGDKDVLVLAAYEGTRIVSLRAFADQLAAPKP